MASVLFREQTRNGGSTCPDCHGLGRQPFDDGERPCHACDCTGRVIAREADPEEAPNAPLGWLTMDLVSADVTLSDLQEALVNAGQGAAAFRLGMAREELAEAAGLIEAGLEPVTPPKEPARPAPAKVPSDLLKVKEVASLLAMNETTVRGLVRRGVIPAWRRGNRLFISRQAALDSAR